MQTQNVENHVSNNFEIKLNSVIPFESMYSRGSGLKIEELPEFQSHGERVFRTMNIL